MKPFLIWLSVTAFAYGAAAGGYHVYLEGNPRRVAVVIDASYAMRPVWSQVSRALREIESQRYAEFSLHTEKGQVHGWSSRLNPGKISPYAPRDFSQLADTSRSNEINEAGEVVLITNASPAEIDPLPSWRVVRLD